MIQDSEDTKERPDTEDLGRVVEFPERDEFEDALEAEEFVRSDKKAADKKISTKVQLLFAVMFFVLIGVMVYIRKGYILTAEENVLSIIVMLVSMVSGLVAFLSSIKDMMKKSSFTSSKESNADMNGFDADDDSIELGVYMHTISVTPSEEMTKSKAAIDKLEVASAAPDCGATVVLTQDDEPEKEITLYSRNADKTIRIPLGNLPVTIGKLEGCVDKVINDKSISRIHCRFDKDADGRISIVDLNSTNGTFRNGLRLSAQEKNFIEEGDEVKIGRICFDCR